MGEHLRVFPIFEPMVGVFTAVLMGLVDVQLFWRAGWVHIVSWVMKGLYYHLVIARRYSDVIARRYSDEAIQYFFLDCFVGVPPRNDG
jgi:hypothetical protein